MLLWIAPGVDRKACASHHLFCECGIRSCLTALFCSLYDLSEDTAGACQSWLFLDTVNCGLNHLGLQDDDPALPRLV